LLASLTLAFCPRLASKTNHRRPTCVSGIQQRFEHRASASDSPSKEGFEKVSRIGDPGAEKILLFAGVLPVLALESNGLRVLLRIGFGKEDKNYSTTYCSVQAAASDGLPTDCEWLTRAHLLLRQHGKELCKTTKPNCEACPVRSFCRYFANI
jgi:endonuclease III